MGRGWLAAILGFACLIYAGCGESEQAVDLSATNQTPNLEPVNVPNPASNAKSIGTASKNSAAKNSAADGSVPTSPPNGRTPSSPTSDSVPGGPSATAGTKPPKPPSPSQSPQTTPDRQSANLATETSANVDETDPYLPRRKLGPLELVPVQLATLTEFGLRHSASKNLLLITDLPEAEIPTEFHAIFEQAIGQWVAFCGADARRFADWRLTCFLVVDEAKFQRAKLFPGTSQLPQGKLPPGGWQYGNQIWVRQQLGTYYTRHMLLHEATHAFMAFNFGALGSPWVAEGLAEYFAVHQWVDGRLQLAARVTSKDELPYWGRVKLIRDAYHVGQPKTLIEVMKFPPSAFPQVDSYAWSWAAVSLFAGHPQLRPVFIAQVQKLGQMSDAQWNRELLQAVPLQQQQLETQWQVDTTWLQYGHDFARTAIDWREAKLTEQSEYERTVPADGAWHATGLKLAPGEWEITTTGSYQVTQSDAGPWISEPEGISIRYVLGAPMGQVQFALQGDASILQGMSELTKPQALGIHRIVKSSGEELFVRVNDHPSQLDDNQGQVVLTIRRR